VKRLMGGEGREWSRKNRSGGRGSSGGEMRGEGEKKRERGQRNGWEKSGIEAGKG
jgi:hypothetical protein